jgi:hypothetical protein
MSENLTFNSQNLSHHANIANDLSAGLSLNNLSLFTDTIANEFGFGDSDGNLRSNLHGFVEVCTSFYLTLFFLIFLS